MDGPALDPAELAANLRDIRRVNDLLGGTSIDSTQQANSTAGFGESSVLIPPAHYLPGDNADTCEPRRGYPQDC